MKLLIFLLVLSIFLTCILLEKAWKTLNYKELKRRARGVKANSDTNKIYKLVSYNESAKLLLWLAGSVSGAILFLIIAGISNSLGILFIMFVAWVLLMQKPLDTGGTLWKLAGFVAKIVLAIVDFLHPVLLKISGLLKKLMPVHFHTGLYDKEDLLELLNAQNHQVDNRINELDLEIAFNALQFGDKKVREIMTPRRAIKLVAASDSVGPLLMDDLHKSGFSRFPVVKAPTKEANPEIIGTLYLKDLLEHGEKGKVKDVMQAKAYYINEDQNLRQALEEFLKTHHHLLIVNNDFQEISGVISLEDVVEQILGKQIIDESNQPEDVRAEAAEEAEEEQGLQSEPKVVE